MEILNKLLESQNSLEDALRLETTPEDIKNTREGKQLLRYLRRRRRTVNRLTKCLKQCF